MALEEGEYEIPVTRLYGFLSFSSSLSSRSLFVPSTLIQQRFPFRLSFHHAYICFFLTNHIAPLILLFLSFPPSPFFFLLPRRALPYPPLSSLLTLQIHFTLSPALSFRPPSLSTFHSPPLQFHLIFILIPPPSLIFHTPSPHSNEFLSPVPSFPALLPVSLSAPLAPPPFPRLLFLNSRSF